MATATTTYELREAFTAQILATTPRYPEYADHGFIFHEKVAGSGGRIRRFNVRTQNLHPPDRSHHFNGSVEEMQCDFVVRVDYGGVRQEILEELADDDLYLIRERLALLKGSIPGLYNVDVDNGGTLMPALEDGRVVTSTCEFMFTTTFLFRRSTDTD